MTFTPKQNSALAEPLDAKHIVKPTGHFGPKGDYLEGWHVINELNRVFGFDGWSYRIELTRDALEQGTDSNGSPQWQAAYTCVCTLIVDEVMRQDVGFGSGFAKAIGDAIEGATKEAATDALKRCARTFGNIFGLALYDKSRANVCAPAPELVNEGHLKALRETMRKVGITEAKACENLGIVRLEAATVEQYEVAIAAMNAVLATRTQQKEAA